MSKIYNGIMGVVVGDAFGVPVEFKERDSYYISEMIGFGTYNQKPGTWSDDSSMTLATLESIGRLGKIDLPDIMNNFCAWFRDRAFTPYDEVFDVGGTTQAALNNFLNGVELSKCGRTDEFSNGNGSLMRILPLTFIPHTVKDIYNVSALTHGHRISQAACTIYVTIAKAIIDGVPFNDAVELGIGYCNDEEFSRLLSGIQYFDRDNIRSSGYVVDSLEAALWCLYQTDNYRDCIVLAVNLGNDTDTIAAIAGGLAGLLYGVGGEKGIPEKWISQIARKDWIKGLCDTLENKLSK